VAHLHFVRGGFAGLELLATQDFRSAVRVEADRRGHGGEA